MGNRRRYVEALDRGAADVAAESDMRDPEMVHEQCRRSSAADRFAVEHRADVRVGERHPARLTPPPDLRQDDHHRNRHHDARVQRLGLARALVDRNDLRVRVRASQDFAVQHVRLEEDPLSRPDKGAQQGNVEAPNAIPHQAGSNGRKDQHPRQPWKKPQGCIAQQIEDQGIARVSSVEFQQKDARTYRQQRYAGQDEQPLLFVDVQRLIFGLGEQVVVDGPGAGQPRKAGGLCKELSAAHQLCCAPQQDLVIPSHGLNASRSAHLHRRTD